MGQCTKGSACPFSHQFVTANKGGENASKSSTEDADKNFKFTVKNDSAPSNRQRDRNEGDEISQKSRDIDENSRYKDDGTRPRQPRHEPNVVFELPNARKREQRARSNSDVKQTKNGEPQGRSNNPGRKAERGSGNSGASFAASKEERQRMREQERAKSESGAQKTSFGVKSLNTLIPVQEESVGAKRARDTAAESPNKRRKVESGAAEPNKDDLDRELDELNLPPVSDGNAGNEEELLDF